MQQPLFYRSKFDIQLWWLSALLISINIALYLYQISHGVNSSDPSMLDAIHWGADYPPLTLLQQPERLFTAMFFHFGLIHLALNMWALYIFGQIVEQIYGRIYFFIIYLFSGLIGNLLSALMSIYDSQTALNTQDFSAVLLPHINAGASGAVMGLGGALTLLAFLPASASHPFILSKKSLILMVLINLSIGILTPNINNFAHIGGFLMGALLCIIWFWAQRKHQLLWGWCLATGVSLVLCYALYAYCMQALIAVKPLWLQLINTI